MSSDPIHYKGEKMQIMATVYDASSLAELVQMLKDEGGYSNDSLGMRIGVGSTTIFRILQGRRVDDETLDKIAVYARVTREWIYELVHGINLRTRHPPLVEQLAALLDDAPEDIQELFLIQARLIIASRKKQNAKPKE